LLVLGVRAGFRVELIHLDIGSFVPKEAGSGKLTLDLGLEIQRSNWGDRWISV
jgi:hypothetical protein